MKKIISILLALCLTGTLVSCRSKPKEEAAGAPSMPTKTSENNGSTSAEPKEQTAEKTDAAAKTEEAKPAEKTAESNPGDEIAAKFGVKVDWDYVETKDGTEWRAPKEDPALQAEAEKILKDKGGYEYYHFCAENDLKYYNDFSENQSNLDPTLILVYLKRSCSNPGKAAPPFEKHIGAFEIKDEFVQNSQTPQQTNEKQANFSNMYRLVFPEDTTIAQAITTVKKLEALPYVQRAVLLDKNGNGSGD